MSKTAHEPIAHLVKRTDMEKWKAWLIRGIAFVLSILACAIITIAITGEGMDYFFINFFGGVFGTPRKIWNLFRELSLLLLVALAVTPCFKMRFWNIGGEGQILMGALGCAVIVNFMGGKASDAGTIIVSLILAIAFGITWAVIPALFKAKWNTNETLLTLMMNYIATCLVSYFIKSVATQGTGNLSFSSGVIGNAVYNEFLLQILVGAVITALVYVYLRFSKHGYELTVVGESENTARYVGINGKKVIIRTLILCGAISGIIGFLLVSATNMELHAQYTVNGRGFTGVLISWLAHFNPLYMVLTSFLVVFIQNGATEVGTPARLGNSFPMVLTGVFFFFIIASEFFINYQIVWNNNKLDIKKVFAKHKILTANVTDAKEKEDK